MTPPRCMTRSEFGWPMYGAELILGDVLLSVPFLPARLGAHWTSAERAGAGFVELTAGTWAQLLYLSSVDPEHIGDAEAIAAADRVLVNHMCDLAVCAGEVEGDLADHPGSCVRWNQCITLSARLCAVTP